MPAHHINTTTTPFAPDEIVDWFVLFEAFMTTQVGWTVSRRVSNTEIFLRSGGELGEFTQLYVHVWRVGAGTTVRMEVCNDTIPTRQTNEGGFIDSGGANPFAFMITANLDCIIILTPNTNRFVYAGALMPFALDPEDETYYMVATQQLLQASVLRFHDGTWDVDVTNYFEGLSDNMLIDPDTGTFPLFGLVADRYNLIIGQYHLISGKISAVAGIAQGDTITTTDEDGTTTTNWYIFRDNGVNLFAVWTGGDIPYGVEDGSFGFTSGVANTPGDFLDAFGAFAASLGWTDNGDTGLPLFAAGDINRQIHSTGEDGLSDIWVTWSYRAAGPEFRLHVHDDAAYTHVGFELVGLAAWLPFPMPYLLAGDKDCIAGGIRNCSTGGYECLWSGKVIPAAPGVSSPYMNIASATLLGTGTGAQVLRNHTGAWNAVAGINHEDVGLRSNSSPNRYDGVSYVLWSDFIHIGNTQMIGMMKYVYQVHGLVTQGDLIPIEDQNFVALMYQLTPYFWALRIA